VVVVACPVDGEAQQAGRAAVAEPAERQDLATSEVALDAGEGDLASASENGTIPVVGTIVPIGPAGWTS